MKSSGLLHPELAALVAAGHTERIVPVAAGLPGVLDVLQALLAELAVEGVTLVEEPRVRLPDWYARFRAVLPIGLPVREVSPVLKSTPVFKLIQAQPADLDRARGLNMMENSLGTQPSIAAVFARNDEMALGAEQTVAAVKRKEFETRKFGLVRVQE